MYGERDAPYTVISRLGKQLAATVAPDIVLPSIVETVAQALKLPSISGGDQRYSPPGLRVRPPALDDLGLIAALAEQLTQQRASGISFTIERTRATSPAVSGGRGGLLSHRAGSDDQRRASRPCPYLRRASGCQEQLTIEIIDDGQGLPPPIAMEWG